MEASWQRPMDRIRRAPRWPFFRCRAASAQGSNKGVAHRLRTAKGRAHVNVAPSKPMCSPRCLFATGCGLRESGTLHAIRGYILCPQAKQWAKTASGPSASDQAHRSTSRLRKSKYVRILIQRQEDRHTTPASSWSAARARIPAHLPRARARKGGILPHQPARASAAPNNISTPSQGTDSRTPLAPDLSRSGSESRQHRRTSPKFDSNLARLGFEQRCAMSAWCRPASSPPSKAQTKNNQASPGSCSPTLGALRSNSPSGAGSTGFGVVPGGTRAASAAGPMVAAPRPRRAPSLLPRNARRGPMTEGCNIGHTQRLRGHAQACNGDADGADFAPRPGMRADGRLFLGARMTMATSTDRICRSQLTGRPNSSNPDRSRQLGPEFEPH